MSWGSIASFIGIRGSVYTLVPAEHAGTFFSGSGDGRVVRWDMRFPEQGEVVVDVGKAVFSLWFDSVRHMLFIGDEAGGLHVIA